MPLIQIKPDGFFVDEQDAGALARYLDYGLEPPSGPGAITDWSVQVVDASSCIVTIRAVPSAGDVHYKGDGRAVLLDLEWIADGMSEPVSFGSPLPGTWTLALDYPESIRVRVMASTGPGPWSSFIIRTLSNVLREDGANLLREDGGQILREDA